MGGERGGGNIQDTMQAEVDGWRGLLACRDQRHAASRWRPPLINSGGILRPFIAAMLPGQAHRQSDLARYDWE